MKKEPTEEVNKVAKPLSRAERQRLKKKQRKATAKQNKKELKSIRAMKRELEIDQALDALASSEIGDSANEEDDAKALNAVKSEMSDDNESVVAAKKVKVEEKEEKEEEEPVIEYIEEDLDSFMDASNPMYSILSQFKQLEQRELRKNGIVSDDSDEKNRAGENGDDVTDDVTSKNENDKYEDGDEDEEDGEPKISNKQKRRDRKLTVAMLKQLAAHPEVVELHDVNSPDPLFHIQLKSQRNVVQVPRHWCLRRRYLLYRHTVNRGPFKLPDFIEATGIRSIRDAYIAKESKKVNSMKRSVRERMRPSLGKIDIDYKILRDAFFKFQTKPRLLTHGDVYYEGREEEVVFKTKRPGLLSEDLRKALGMTSPLAPPPWLPAMQRYGPPPSYPKLRVPGVNAPIPAGAQYGTQAGGWGNPPVDPRTGRPMFGGDPLGVASSYQEPSQPVELKHWGEIDPAEDISESESEEEEEEDEDGEEVDEDVEEEGSNNDDDNNNDVTNDIISGGSVKGDKSMFGMETPASIDLVKRSASQQQQQELKPLPPQVARMEEEQKLYTVLKEVEVKRQGGLGNLMGSNRVYVMGDRLNDKDEEVTFAIDSADLDRINDGDFIEKKREEALKERKMAEGRQDDNSDMVAEHEHRKQKKKDKKKKFKF